MIVMLLIFCAAIGAATAALTIIGVTIYDITSIRRYRLQGNKKYQRIVALIVDYKTEADIARISRMVAIPYKNLRVIVINQTGRSNIKQKLNADNKRLFVFSSQKPFAETAMNACKKYNHTKGLMVVIGRDSEIDEASLYEMINYMVGSNSHKSALLNRFYNTHFNIGGLISTYSQSLTQLTYKTRSAFKLPIAITSLDTIVYKDPAYIKEGASVGFIASSTAFVGFSSSIWSVLAGQIQTRIHTWLHSRKIMFTNGKTARAWTDWLFYIAQQLALFAFIIPAAYIIYLAIGLHQPVLFFVCVGMLVLGLIYALWSDNQLDARYRVSLLAQLPIICVLLPFWVILPILVLAAFVLEVLANMVKAKFPRRIGLFARVKNILRIV